MITGFVLGVLLVCYVIVWYKVSAMPDDVDANNIVQVKKEMYLAMTKQGKKLETTPAKNLYRSTSKRWIRE